MFDNFRKYWDELPERARMGLIAGTAAILVLMFLASYWVFRTEYQVLFSDLQPQDAASMIGELERMKIPYKLSEGEGKIQVDKSRVHETRLKLMGKGMSLNGNVGFEIFDKSDYGMTEYAQKINYQRALQGELARTISSIKEVKLARVHLVLPESSIFKQDKSQPKASVSLVLKEETRLTPEQIRGIQGLVSASVSNLDPSEVTVLDQRGVMLSGGNLRDGGLPALSGQLTIKKEVEGYLTRKAVEVLDRAFGPGQAIVSVDVAMNYDNVKSTEESVVPVVINAEGAVGAIHRKRTTTQQQSYPERGTADQAAATSRTANHPQSTTSEVEYTLGRKVEQIVTTPGSISRLSIGVLVPHDMEESRLAKVRDIVAMAVGMNPKRGDVIAVHSVRQFLPLGSQKESQEISGAEQHISGKPPQRTFSDHFRGILNQAFANPLGTAAVIVMLLAIAGVGFRYWPAVRRWRTGLKHQPELTPQQRDELLLQIKEWVGLESKPVENRGKP